MSISLQAVCQKAMPRIALAVALGTMPMVPAQAANIIEKAIAQANPCSGNSVKVSGVTIGIDRFDRVEIKEFSVSGTGSKGQASVTGFLSCKTSDEALFPGDANADFTVKASFDLSTCAVDSRQVDIPRTGGKYGLAVNLLKPKIIQAIEFAIVSEAPKLCK